MKRNWDAIRGISCRSTQVAIATCSDPAILPRLQQTFPECFAEGEETVIGTWPDILRKRKESDIANGGDGAYASVEWLWEFEAPQWESALFEFGRDGSICKDGLAPKEIVNQLRGDINFNAPVFIHFRGKEWVVAELWHQDHLSKARDLSGDLAKGLNATVKIIPKEYIIFDL